MISATAMLEERIKITEGSLKGARITLPFEDIVKFAEDYHKQFENEIKNNGIQK
jgi:hypothetical protein